MARGEGEELTLLATLTALALAQGKNAEETGLLAGFLVVVSDALALLSIFLAAAESAQEEKETKAEEERLETRLAKIEAELLALKECCKS